MEFSNVKVILGDHSISFPNFCLKKNSLNAILGVSGKGKTTLLKYLHGTFSESPPINSCYISAENYFLKKKHCHTSIKDQYLLKKTLNYYLTKI